MPPDDGYLVGEVFFFQAEDGIRDPVVTGVQTCALPIYPDQSPDSHCRISFYGSPILPHTCQLMPDWTRSVCSLREGAKLWYTPSLSVTTNEIPTIFSPADGWTRNPFPYFNLYPRYRAKPGRSRRPPIPWKALHDKYFVTKGLENLI